MMQATNRESGGARVGRKLKFPEKINLAVPEGTRARLDALLAPGEDRLEMIRGAIEKEARRRERLTKKIAEDG